MNAPTNAAEGIGHRPDGPAFEVPADACDCHMHLFDTRLPFAAGAGLTHGDASPDEYRALQRRLGLTRNVIVQPSSYGRDHRVLRAGLRAFGAQVRGVAVVGPDVDDAELSELHAAGVLGTRFNLVQHGATGEAMLEAVAQRIRPLGWHVQVHLHPADLLRWSDRLVSLPVPVVIDHFARVHADPELAQRVQTCVDDLLATGRVWLKLSAPYIACGGDAPPDALGPFVRGLVQRHPDRLLWGTDWPHVTEAHKPDDARLMNLLAAWLPDAGARQRILVDNPHVLYRF